MIVEESSGSIVGVEFFPTDLINSEFSGEQTERGRRLEFLKGYIRDQRLAEIVVDLDDSINRTDEKKRFLSEQSHAADLVWISTELKGIIANFSDRDYNGWGSGEFSTGLKERIKLLCSAVDKRVAEIP